VAPVSGFSYGSSHAPVVTTASRGTAARTFVRRRPSQPPGRPVSALLLLCRLRPVQEALVRDPLLSTAGDTTPGDTTDIVRGEPVPDPAAPPRTNRAARRGRSGKQAQNGAVHPGSTGRARAAQGRRINPVRRTG
jgi:hypothetical protein